MILSACLCFGSTSIAAEIPSNEISIRTSIIVDAEYLTLHDFFGVADERALKRVAHSPKPGRTMTFDAKWLYRVARAYKINWRPINFNTRVIVERASQQIRRDEIENAIIAHLRKKGMEDKFEITLRRLNRIHVATNQFASVAVEHLTYEEDSGRFIANLAAPANSPSAERFRVNGRVHKLKIIPTINKRLRRGHPINKNDIEWTNFRASKIGKNIILEEEDLIGMAAKRVIREKTPIRYSELQKPILIKKGGLVTINLTTPVMHLTAQGKALQEGSKGDTIPIKNVQSKQTIEASVTGINDVTVVLPFHTALN